MTDLIHSITSSQPGLPSDGSMAVTITATVYTDGAPAAAGVTVNWASSVTYGILSSTTSTTDNTGVATILLTASAVGNIKVTAKASDDTTGKSVIVTASKALIAATILNASEADGYTLDQYDISFGVTATIPSYSGAAAGQTVTFNWDVIDKKQIMVTSLTQFPIVIDVSNDMKPACLTDGSYEVYYDVSDPAGNMSYSSSIDLTVSKSGQSVPTLDAPEIPVADDGYINIADANNGVEVDITYDGITEGDLVTLFWNAFDKSSNPIQNASTTFPYTVLSTDTSVVFTLDSSLFYPGQSDQGYEGTVNAYYTVQRSGIPSALLSYPTDANVDTVAP